MDGHGEGVFMRRQLDGSEGAEKLGAVCDGKMDIALEADADVAVTQARHGIVPCDKNGKAVGARAFHGQEVAHKFVHFYDTVVAFANGAEDFELEGMGESLFDGFRGVPLIKINRRR